jgi:hypothetical protein
MGELSVTQTTVYEALKVGIREGLDSIFKTGQKLLRIRNEKLYRDEYPSFKEFCKAEYDLAEQRAYQYIDAAKIKDALPPKTQQLLSNESQARQLKSVAPSQRSAVLRKASKDGPPTAAKIAEAAKPKEPVIDLDKEGNPIPEAIMADWQHAYEVGHRIYTLLSEVKDLCATGLKDGERDIAFAEIANPTLAEIDALRYSLGQIVPYVICPTCRGKLRKTCDRCRKRGWISKFLHKNTSSKEERKK